MAKAITNTAQLSTYSIIRGIIRADTELGARFRQSDFYRFEPKMKNANLPYIVINLPSPDTNLLVFNHSTNIKDFTATVRVVIDFSAQDKLENYCNTIIRRLEANESTSEASGYYHVKAELTDSGPEIISEKDVVAATIDVIYRGRVNR